MNLTDKKRLIALIETFVDSEKSRRRHRNAGRVLAKRYPPKRRVALYANILRDAVISDRGRWVVMLMLYYVGNDDAIEGFMRFYEDPEMPDALKFDALLFMFSLNPRLRYVPSALAPRFPIAWLRNGFKKLPPLPTEERHAYVLDRLNIDIFEERNES